MRRFRFVVAVAAAATMIAGLPVAGTQASSVHNRWSGLAPKLTKLTSAQAAKLGFGQSQQHVIVIMNNQFSNLGARHFLATRSSAIAATERPVVTSSNRFTPRTRGLTA